MEKDEHFYDACYEVWRNGGNPDRVNPVESDDHWYAGKDPQHTSYTELERQRRETQARNQSEDWEINPHFW